MRARMSLGLAVTALGCAAGPAGATVRLGDDAALHALAADRGRALAVLDSGDREEPWLLVRSGGSSASDAGTFGAPDSEFPDVSSGHVGWAVPVTGGVRLEAARLGGLNDPTSVGFATGPGALAHGLVVYPDVEGDLEVATIPGGSVPALKSKLTDNAPETRHLALDVAGDAKHTLILDLVQRRGVTELRVIGRDAPEAAVMALGRVRHVPATIAVSEDLVAVAWLASGRARVATSRSGEPWQRRSLPGRGGGIGAPAVGISGGEVLVAYSQKAAGRGGREIYVWRDGGAERWTEAPGDDRDPHLAVDEDGIAFLGWTRRHRGETSALLARVD